MTLALSPNSPFVLDKLIVEDIAPTQGEISREFVGYIDAMEDIESRGVKTRGEAGKILEGYEAVGPTSARVGCHLN